MSRKPKNTTTITQTEVIAETTPEIQVVETVEVQAETTPEIQTETEPETAKVETVQKMDTELYDIKTSDKLVQTSYYVGEDGEIRKKSGNVTLKFSELSESQRFKALFEMYFRTHRVSRNGKVQVRTITFASFKKVFFHDFISSVKRQNYFMSKFKLAQAKCAFKHRNELLSVKNEKLSLVKVSKTQFYWKEFLELLIQKNDAINTSFNVDEYSAKAMAFEPPKVEETVVETEATPILSEELIAELVA